MSIEGRAQMRRDHAEAIAAVVAEAPPLPADVIDMLRADGFPFRPVARDVEDEATAVMREAS